MTTEEKVARRKLSLLELAVAHAFRNMAGLPRANNKLTNFLGEFFVRREKFRVPVRRVRFQDRASLAQGMRRAHDSLTGHSKKIVAYEQVKRLPRLREKPFCASSGGGGGIRTPGGLPHNGFQDRRLQPLGHSSANS